MKTIIAYIVIAALAVSGGYGSALLYHNYKVSRSEETFYSQQWLLSDASELSSRAIVSSPQHDFGIIDSNRTYRHEFVVESRGSRDLEIWYQAVEGSPFQVDLTEEKVTIERGTTLPLTVSFEGREIKEDFDAEFSVNTNQNDGKPLILRISGQLPKSE